MGLSFRGPHDDADSDDEKYHHTDRHAEVNLGGAFMDVDERFVGSLWFEAHDRVGLRLMLRPERTVAVAYF